MKKTWTKSHKRILSLLSVLLAAFIIMPPAVFAADIEEQPEAVPAAAVASDEENISPSPAEDHTETVENISTEESPSRLDEAPAPFSVTVENEKSPSGELFLGASYSIGGTILSDSVIAKVCGGIYTAGGEKVVYREVTPDANSCNIAQGFDAAMTFGSLAIGEYVFQLEAEDGEGHKAVAVHSPFSVVDGVIPSEITVTDESVPADEFPQGSGFSIRGMIASTYRLTSVKGGVYHTDGTPTEVYYEDAPNLAMYNLNATFDLHLGFRGLTPGSYIYRIEATDLRGFSQTVIEKAFSIVEKDAAASDIHVYGATYPTGTLRQGKGFSFKGAVFSSHKLAQVWGGIFKAEGSTAEYNDEIVFSVNPEKTSFNLANFDSQIALGSLPVGEYFFTVSAKDELGYEVELIHSIFRIRSVESDEDSPEIAMKGVDVSAYQGDIDWNAAYADGVDFAILRAGVTNNGDANFRQDATFEQNYRDASAAGVKLGAYLYTSAVNKSEMKADIDALLSTIKGKTFDMPIYIDVEANRQTNLSKAALTELVKYGCELLSEAGCKAGVYASINWFKNNIDTNLLSNTDCEIWLAFWPDNPDNYNLSDFCVTWQYTDSGKVEGMTGNIDKDYRYAALSAEKHTVIIEQAAGGSIAADRETAGYGERVTLTVTPEAGYDIISVRYGDYEAARMENGTYAFSMPKNDVTVTAAFQAYAHTEEKAATCTEDGNKDYYSDFAGNRYVYKDGAYIPVDKDATVVKATGHDWDYENGMIDAEKGEVTYSCRHNGEHTATESLQAVTFTPDSSFRWIIGSKDGMTVIVKNTDNHQDKLTFSCFKAVYVDGVPVEESNYAAEAGSVRITFSPAYLVTLSEGVHTVKVELSYASVEHAFTVSAAGALSPATGESGLPGLLGMALMLLAAYGMVYAFSRRRMRVE